MALLTYNDIQESLNIDLSNPNGQTIAGELISAAVAYAESVLSFPLEEAQVTEYFDQGQYRFWLNTTAPVSNLTIAQYNSITSGYDAIAAQYIRHGGDANVYVTTSLPSGFQMVKADYTTGWTGATLPKDLRRALIELVGIKLQEVTNYSSNPDDPAGDSSGAGTGALKKVQAGSVTLEYAVTANDSAWKGKLAQLSKSIGDSVPASILTTFEKYRRPFAI
jgi:hypothetical protein